LSDGDDPRVPREEIGEQNEHEQTAPPDPPIVAIGVTNIHIELMPERGDSDSTSTQGAPRADGTHLTIGEVESFAADPSSRSSQRRCVRTMIT
jgi:hypothetical protein